MILAFAMTLSAHALTPKLLSEPANYQSGVKQTSIKQVTVTAPAGQVFVFARKEKEVLVECEFDPEYQPKISKTTHTVTVTIAPKTYETLRCAIGYPADSELKLSLESGQIEMSGVKSAADISLKSGTVRIKNTVWPEVRYEANLTNGSSTPVLDASKDPKAPLIRVKVESGMIQAL